MKTCPVCKRHYADNLLTCPSDGEPLEADLTAIVGTVLDGLYRIEALLGRGGMGAVYRAKHELLGDLVAIKLIPPALSSNPEYRRRFLREGQAARKIKHPHVVAIHDLRLTSDSILYMVMEYIEGRSFGDVLDSRKHLSPEETVQLLEPIAAALSEAHSLGIVHRDLKPDNVMIGRDDKGRPVSKLLDLGLAKNTVTELSELTRQGQILGTPQYMPPEQWEGQELDARADIYSFAVMVYESVAGRRPFDGKTIESLAAQHALSTPTPLSQVREDISLAFSDVVAKGMAKKPEQRYSTIGEFMAALKACVNNQTMSYHKPSAQDLAPLDETRVLTPAKDLKTLKTESAAIETVDIQGNERKRRVKALLALSSAAVVIFGLLLSIRYLKTEPTTPLVIADKYAKELFRYRMEVATDHDTAVKYVTADPVLASGDRFRFTFTPRAEGYIYILGPGKNNQPTLFLGNQPFSEAGIESNRLIVEARFSFPALSAASNWLVLDKTIGIDKWTVIFSKEKLSTYTFLEKHSGYILNSDDLEQLEKLREQSVKFQTLLREIDGPYLSLLRTDEKSELLLIDILIEHR